ncbi:nucleotidyltransferase [Flavobacterium sp. '19STA2R22 D10 B1']|uniref:nucleotidyltransferase n=1 Tax=Flavobacterium aerium TaxID=3037261 RepID=UPI00278C55F8|nr:nucleotidyltransferase [Flavobacterium sp. '19STA2R22 D10 B1']
MARSKTVIQEEILNDIAQNSYLQGLNSVSNASIFKNFVYSVAYVIWTLEVLFDTHKKEIDGKILTQKVGRAPWWKGMAEKFQWGFSLVYDHDYFDNGTATEEEIEASKIIKYCAVTPVIGSSLLIIKIAGETSGVLSPITEDQQESFHAYMERVGFAGVPFRVINYLPDRLILSIRIFRDPLVLNGNGMSILDGNFPVEIAIREFMKELPFDGELVLDSLATKLKTVPGVLIPSIDAASSSWINPDTGGYGQPQPIDVKTIPVSGYFEVQNFDTISYVV